MYGVLQRPCLWVDAGFMSLALMTIQGRYRFTLWRRRVKCSLTFRISNLWLKNGQESMYDAWGQMEGESTSPMSLQVIWRSMGFSDNIHVGILPNKMVLMRGRIGTLQKLQGQWWMRRIYLIVIRLKWFLQPFTLWTGHPLLLYTIWCLKRGRKPDVGHFKVF